MLKNNRKVNIAIILSSLALVFMQFQNCSDVAFTGADSSISKTCAANPADPLCVVQPPGPLPPMCEPGFTYVDGECVQSNFTDCRSFVELNTSVIPSLESTGVCYYKKLIDASPTRSSGSFGESVATDVISRRHCIQSGQSANSNPYVLGDNQLDLIFLAQRNISLTSSKVGNVDEIAAAKLKVDNYILVKFQMQWRLSVCWPEERLTRYRSMVLS